MKAFISSSPGPIESNPLVCTDLPTPTPRGGELLVRVHCCGVCRTDLHVVEGDLPRQVNPIVPGHQVVGEVVAKGESCGQKYSIGDRVGIAWLRSTCGRCEYCTTGRENLCERSEYAGYHHNGGYAEFVTAPEDFVYPIPRGLTPESAAPLLCAGIIGYRALKKSNLPSGGKLALFGFGSSAHITMQAAKARGAEVYVATRGEEHRAFARSLGAAWVGDTFDEIPEKVHSAIVFAPAGEIIPQALYSVRKGGTTVLAGIHMSSCPPLDYERHLFHEKQLVSVEANCRADGHELFGVAAAYNILPEVVTFPFTEANRALMTLKHDGIRGTGVLIFPEINS